MPSLRLLLPASTLLVLGLCWSVNASPTKRTLHTTGSVTNYITPVANLTLAKLVGRWYIAEAVSLQPPPNETAHACLQLDFHYNDNGTLVVEPVSLVDGARLSANYTFSISENGVWDAIYFGVSGEVERSSSHLVVHVDDRFLAVATCKNSSVKDCQAYVLVRRVADADGQRELEAIRRRLASAGVDNIDSFVKIIEPCKSTATAASELSDQTA